MRLEDILSTAPAFPNCAKTAAAHEKLWSPSDLRVGPHLVPEVDEDLAS